MAVGGGAQEEIAGPGPRHGSKYQLQRWVNERAPILEEALADWPTLGAWKQGPLDWLSPRPPMFRELADDMWRAIPLPEPTPRGSGWWPAGGPHWDAVARVPGPVGQVGALLVEAKGRKSELRSFRRATDADSIKLIADAIWDVQSALGVARNPTWLSGSYQAANRLAYLWFARTTAVTRIKLELNELPVWLCSIYFLGDEYKTVTRTEIGPASEEQWRPHIDNQHSKMGLQYDHPLAVYHHECFLPALKPPSEVG